MGQIRLSIVCYPTVTLLLLTTIPCPNGLSVYENSGKDAVLPEFWLDEYGEFLKYTSSGFLRTEEIFENDFFSKNGTEYVLSENLDTAVFVCESEYPVKISFPYPEQLRPVSSYGMVLRSRRQSTLIADKEEPINHKFRAYLFFEALNVVNYKFLSATVTCESTHLPSDISVSIHLYVPKLEMIEHKGKTIQVEVPVDNFKTLKVHPVLPCRPSSPDVEISLFMQISSENKTTWMEIFHHEMILFSYYYDMYTVSYNPRIGFTMRYKDFQNTFGKKPLFFKCVVVENPDEFVLVNLSFVEKLTPPVHFDSKKVIKGDASISLVFTEIESEIRCCSGVASKPPLILAAACSNPVHCDLLKYTETWRFQKLSPSKLRHHSFSREDDLKPDNCSVDFSVGSVKSPILAFCKGENLDYVGEFVYVKNPERNDTSRDEVDERNEDIEASTIGAIKVEQKMEIKLTRLLPWAKRDKMLYGRYLSKVENFTSPFTPGDGRWSESKNRIIVVNYLTTVVYEDDVIHVLCLYGKFYYSSGGHVRINWTNKTRTIVEVEDKLNFILYDTKKTYVLNTDILVPSKPVRVKLGMMSVDCFAPIWNTTEWDKLTYQFNVLPSYKPKFSGAEEETVYLGLSEVSCELNCELIEGLPQPKFVILKDGRKVSPYHPLFNVTTGHIGNTSFVKLSLSKISHEHHGTYQCMAENVKGKAVKVFNVFITTGAYSSRVYPVIFVCVGVLIAVITGAGLKYWFQKRQLKALLRQSSYVRNVDN